MDALALDLHRLAVLNEETPAPSRVVKTTLQETPSPKLMAAFDDVAKGNVTHYADSQDLFDKLGI